MTYEALKDFTKTVGTNERLLQQTDPMPLSLNAIVDQPEVQHRQGEWFTFFNSLECQEYVKSHPDDELAMKMLGSMAAKGKGKSGGKSDKGGFQGQC